MKTTVILLIASAVIATTAVACKKEKQADTKRMLLCFTPYTVTPMDRGQATVVNLADIVTKLDLYLVNAADHDTIEIHQDKATAGNNFGIVDVDLLVDKTYDLYAIAHKFTDPVEFDGERFTFPGNENFRQTLYAYAQFCPGTTASLTVEMQRIVGMFKLVIPEDGVPAEVSKMRFLIDSMGMAFNVDGYAEDIQQRTATINSLTPNGGSITFNVFVTADTMDAINTVDIIADALDSSYQIVKRRIFTEVPIKAGYMTTFSGIFFNDAAFEVTFTAGDWNAFDPTPF